MFTARRGIALAAASVLLSLTALSPAHADTTIFRDRLGDTGVRGDITTVRVKHGAYRVTVAVSPGRVKIGDFFRFWLDTRAGNAGPEYKVEVYPNSDGIGLMRVDAFGQTGVRVRCDGLRATADIYAPAEVSISVPRSCLGTPRKVRVSVRGEYAYRGPNVVDWAPARRTFFAWVPR
jgi:ribosomal protein S28E/S33